VAKPLFIITADMHLNRRGWRHRNIFGDAYHSFEQVVDYAISQRLPIIGAGDLIDNVINESEPIVFLARQLEKLREAAINFIYTQGQHEMSATPWMELRSQTPHHLHKRMIEIGNWKLYGLDYQPHGVLQQELQLIPKEADILVCHQVWSNFMGEIANPQGAFEDIPHVNHVLTGDFHKTILKTYRGQQGQKLQVFSPGSTCMQEISEDPIKFFGVFHSDGTITKHKLQTRAYLDAGVLNTEDAFEETLGQLPKMLGDSEHEAEMYDVPSQLRTPLLRVVAGHRIRDAEARLNRAIQGRAHLFLKSLPPTDAEREVPRPKRAKPGEAITLESCLDDEIPEDQPKARDLARRLLAVEGGPDAITAELLRWKQEQIDAE
jgi:hypothetical protein